MRSTRAFGESFCFFWVALAVFCAGTAQAVSVSPSVSGPVVTDVLRPTWTWTPSQPQYTTFRYQLDGESEGGWSGDTSSTSHTPDSDLIEGPHTLFVQEKDGGGAWSPSGSWTITVDTPPATPEVTCPGVWKAQYPTWTWTPGGGGNGTYRFKLDDSDLSSGATETTQTGIQSPSYIQFNSADDARCGRNTSVPVGDNWTAEAWVKADTVTGDHVILELNWSLEFGVNDGRLYYDGNGTVVQTPDAVITPGVWTHVALVKQNNPYLASFYVNGNCVYRNMRIGSGSGSAIVIGNDANGGRGWDGGIRDVRLWDHVRGGEQIRLGMHQPLAGTETGLLGWWLLDDFTPEPGKLVSEDDGPNGYDLFWYDFYPLPALQTGLYLPGPLDEGSHILYVQERDETGNWSDAGFCEIVVDMTAPPAPSVSGIPAVTETTWTLQSGGADGNGTFRYRFLTNDFNQGYTVTTDTELVLGLPPYLELTGHGVLQADVNYFDFDMGFTLSAWVKPAALEGSQVLLNIGNSAPGYDTLFRIEDGHLKIAYEGLDDDWEPFSASVVSDTVVALDEWQHVAVVYDKGESVARLYLNGQPAGEGPFAAYGYLDMYFVGGTREGADYYTGGIRDLRVSLHADSQGEINYNMWWTGNLASFDQSWMFDDMCGDRAAGTQSTLYFTAPDTGIWHGTRRGDVAMYVQERDNAGNWSETGEASAYLDNVRPGKPVFTSTDQCTADLTYTWEWESGGGGAGLYMCSLNGGPWFLVDGTSWTPAEDMPLGSNTFQVFEMDDAGNVSEIVWREIYADPTWTKLEIATSELDPAIVDGSYSFQLEATGGTAPYTWYDQSEPYCVVPDTERLVFPAGTPVELIDDYDYVTFTLPWNFTFDGGTNNKVDVYTQGVDVPSVGWFWFNPYFESTKTVTQLITDDYAVFNFELTPSGTTDVARCEIVLYPSGEVLFQDYNTYNGEHYFDWYGYTTYYYDLFYAGEEPAFHLEARPTLTALGLAVSPGGLITGTPTQVGEFTLAFGVEDWDSEAKIDLQQWAEKELTLTVVELPTPVMAAEPAWSGGTANTVAWTCDYTDQFQAQCAADVLFTQIVEETGWITGLSYEFTGLGHDQTYYYRVRSGLSYSDAVSGWSLAVSSRQDAVGPGGVMSVDAYYNKQTTITLNILEDMPGDTALMSIYNGETGPTGLWDDFAVTVTWLLPAGDGVKTVYAALQDSLGNVNVISVECMLDTVAPVVTVEIANGAAYTRSQWNLISYTADDFGSGVSELRTNLSGTWTDWAPGGGATVVEPLADGDGEKTVYAEFKDYAGNVGSSSDSIVMDLTPPVITLLGEAEVTVEVHGSYTDEGATAEDNLDGDITANIVTGGLPVNTNVVGDYTVTYNVTDAADNPADQVTRTVHVVDTTKPVITLLGEAEVTVEVDGVYTDEGATAEDNYDGNITANIVTDGLPVDTSVVDSYTVTYDVTDAAGNPADTVIRIVHVIEGSEGEGEGEGEEGEGEGEEGEGEGEEGEGEGEEGEGEGEEGEGEGEEGEGEGEEGGGFYLDSFADGATIYVSSSAGPIPLVFTVTAPAGTQSVTYEDNGTELTLEEPPYRFVSWMNVDFLAWGAHDFSITALLADETEVSSVIAFTFAPPPLNSDLDANGIPDNPFDLLNDGDLWLNQSYVHETGTARMTAVRRVEAATVTDRVRTELLSWDAPESGVTVTVPGGVLAEGQTGIVIVSTAADLYALLGESMDLVAADAPEGYVLPEGGMYTEVSVLTSEDGVNYQELPDLTLAASPVDITVSLPSADPSTLLFAYPTEILSDPDTGLFPSPVGDGWTSDNVTGLSIDGSAINARLTSLSLIAPFVIETAEGEGEGEEGEGEGEEGEGEGEVPPLACFNTDKLAGQARADLIPLAIAMACLMVGQAVRRRRD